jgi:hypothetical protein
MEFRIYCEDVEGCPIGIVMEGVQNLFADLCDDAPPREADDASEQGASLWDNVIPLPRTSEKYVGLCQIDNGQYGEVKLDGAKLSPAA